MAVHTPVEFYVKNDGRSVLTPILLHEQGLVVENPVDLTDGIQEQGDETPEETEDGIEEQVDVPEYEPSIDGVNRLFYDHDDGPQWAQHGTAANDAIATLENLLGQALDVAGELVNSIREIRELVRGEPMDHAEV